MLLLGLFVFEKERLQSLLPIQAKDLVLIDDLFHQPSAALVYAAATDICAASGEASDDKLTASELSFDNTDIQITGCTFTIDGDHTFTGLDITDTGVLNQTVTTTTT